MDELKLARGLGWFSIGLGTAQVLSPGGVSRLIGIRDEGDNLKLMRAMGLRELSSGLGILAQDDPTPWVWSRVAGDALDLALLGTAFNSDGTDKKRLAGATANVVGVTLLDLICARGLSEQDDVAQRSREEAKVDVQKTITVTGTPEELYNFWHDFENLPRFMGHLESVTVSGDGRSHWKAKAPAGRTVEWDAEVVEDRPNELIAWRSLEGADVPNSGSVRFTPAPGDQGTEVRVKLQYDPPAGGLGVAIAKLFGEEPSLQVRDDLRAFKQVIELGEVVVSEATLVGARSPQRPAQPPEKVPA